MHYVNPTINPALKWLAACLFMSQVLFAAPAPDSLIYGFGIQINVNIGRRQSTDFRLGVSASAGKIMYRHTVAAYHFSANLYRGGPGNSLLPTLQNKYQVDLVNGFTLTGGGQTCPVERPLYHWSPHVAPSLINPFGKSGTLGANFIWNNHHRSQQVGFMGVALGQVSLGYYNDGPPFNFIGLGDGNDRWWTGGGYLHWTGQNLYQALYYFDKFTGFQRNGYELANLLRLNYVMYQDMETMTYNRGRNGLRLVTPYGLAVQVERHNQFDVQDLIHRVLRYPFHPNAYQPIAVFGAQYQYTSSQWPLK